MQKEKLQYTQLQKRLNNIYGHFALPLWRERVWRCDNSKPVATWKRKLRTDWLQQEVHLSNDNVVLVTADHDSEDTSLFTRWSWIFIIPEHRVFVFWWMFRYQFVKPLFNIHSFSLIIVLLASSPESWTQLKFNLPRVVPKFVKFGFNKFNNARKGYVY